MNGINRRAGSQSFSLKGILACRRMRYFIIARSEIIPAVAESFRSLRLINNLIIARSEIIPAVAESFRSLRLINNFIIARSEIIPAVAESFRSLRLIIKKSPIFQGSFWSCEVTA